MSDAALLGSVEAWLAPAVSEAGSLRRVSLGDLLLGQLDWRQRAELHALAPTHLEVPSGSRIALSYDDAAAPVLAVRLQEMFGATATPAVGGGRVPVTLHLLSPAGRAVQVTRDLPSFWRGAYFDVRKDLRGRYPKHHWPEDPMAAPPRRGARRRE
jgi:ATP-dependent helicase HrpB